MQKRIEEQMRLKELNRQFLQEIENGKGWEDVKHLMEEMKEVAKKIDHQGTVVSFDNYPLENKMGNSSR